MKNKFKLISIISMTFAILILILLVIKVINNKTNKNIYIFVTSGSSSFGSSLKDLKETYPNLNFISGIRLTGSSTDEEILTWLK